jgi:putative oxidoreductase
MKRTMQTSFKQHYLDLWLLLFRILLAGFMLTHGLPKFYKLLAGGNIEFLDLMGIGPPVSLALAVFAEVICSTFILIGLATRLATVPLIITMLVAVFIVHGSDPMSKKELPLLYLFSYITVFILGSGKYSIDFLLTRKMSN